MHFDTMIDADSQLVSLIDPVIDVMSNTINNSKRKSSLPSPLMTMKPITINKG